jgi:periplasmic divalent cation tolerance protein
VPARGEPGVPAQLLLVLTTLDDGELAERLAREAVEQRLAACVHMLPAGRSVYRWQDEVEQTTEHTLLIKTAADRYPALEAWLVARHPYQTPEIIALPIGEGLHDYLDWIRRCTR